MISTELALAAMFLLWVLWPFIFAVAIWMVGTSISTLNRLLPS